MMFTPKRAPSTSLTVSETPLSATEPFAAMKRREARAALDQEPGAVAVGLAADDHGAAIDMAGHQMAAELIAEGSAPVRD